MIKLRITAPFWFLSLIHGASAMLVAHRRALEARGPIIDSTCRFLGPIHGRQKRTSVGDRDDAEEQVLHLSVDELARLPPGIPKGFYVVKTYPSNSDIAFNWSSLLLDQRIEDDDVDRLDLSPFNITLPVALMIMDSESYPSLSRARKACRKGNVLVHRGPLRADMTKPWVSSCDDKTSALSLVFDPNSSFRGRVGDRIFPGDVVAKQVRMGTGYFPVLGYKKPPFDLPVVYEDDYFALVNKPAGVVVYSQGNGGHGVMTVRAALPFVLRPPKLGTYSVLRRPASVHRLDKPTSGILCIAKTKPAMNSLSKQFHDRIVKKTYVAIVNGIPLEREEMTISSPEAYRMGVDVAFTENISWQLIDSPLDDKNAITLWRAVKYVPSLHASDGYLTLVELKPKTGRYHQLRRHMSLICGCPIIGDDEYDGGTESALRFRERGLFLCSSRVTLEHPYYNSDDGRTIWEMLSEKEKFGSGNIRVSSENRVLVEASIAIPEKFHNFLTREEERYHKFAEGVVVMKLKQPPALTNTWGTVGRSHVATQQVRQQYS